MKFGGGLARNIDFDAANFPLLVKTRRKTSIFDLQLVKIGRGLARNAHFLAPTCLDWSLCLCRVYGEAAKPFVVQCVKVSKLKEVSHGMLVLWLQHV